MRYDTYIRVRVGEELKGKLMGKFGGEMSRVVREALEKLVVNGKEVTGKAGVKVSPQESRQLYDGRELEQKCYNAELHERKLCLCYK